MGDKKNKKYSVIIIGAGISGLTIGNGLISENTDFGVDFAILEAKERVGGRIHTVQRNAQKFEVGAAWIHGVVGNPLFSLIKRLGFTVEKICDGNPAMKPHLMKMQLRINGQPISEFDQARGLEAYSRFKSVLMARAADCEDDTVSVADVVEELLDSPRLADTTSLDKTLIRFYLSLVENWMGASLESLQLIEFAPPEDCTNIANIREEDLLYGDHPGMHGSVKEGMESVMETLAEEIQSKIRFNCEVAEVRYPDELGANNSQKGVEVVTTDGEILKADACVVTVSLGCLKDNTIAFHPPLPDWKLAAVGRLGMGAYKKVLLQFEEPFWDKDVPFFGGITTENQDCIVKDRNGGQNILIENAYFFQQMPALEIPLVGLEGWAAVDYTAQEMKALTVNLLEKIFDGIEIPEPIDITITEWEGDPHCRGAYSFYTTQSSPFDVDLLSKQVGASLFFAGEATSPEYQGSMAGAMISGQRVVDEILYEVAESSNSQAHSRL